MSRRRASQTAAQSSQDVRRQTKVCPVCHRPFNNRRKWAARGIWDSIVYCSERCRRSSSS